MKASFLFLLFGVVYCASSVSAVIDPVSLFAAAAAAVSAISGTAYTALSTGGGPRLVTVNMVIENWTQWTLWDQRMHVEGGTVSDTGAPRLPQATKTTMRAQKAAFSATGSYGAVSFQVGDSSLNRRVWIMWSVAYDQYLYPSNWLAVGISDASYTDADSAYNAMYYDNTHPHISFTRRPYNQRSIRRVLERDNDIIVEGQMGTGQTPTVRVIVRPVNDENLAMPIQQELSRSKK